MNTKHTKGPWITEDGYAVLSDRGEYLASVRSGEADARFIAAAPELLDALKDALGCLVRIGERNPDEQYPHVIANARAAIAKATGR